MRFIDLFRFLLGLSFLAPSWLFAQNVGIGTTTPLEKLHVAGNIRLDALAGVDTRLAGIDPNGTMTEVIAGTPGQVLVQGPTGPVWQDDSGWGLLGNAGTVPATNFVGTTDNQGLAFRTNNLERGRFTNGGNFCVNGTAPIGTDMISAYASGSQYAVNGYSSGVGDAGYFFASGTGAAVYGHVTGSLGSAGEFLTLSAAPSNSPTIYAYNGSAIVPTLQLRTDVANPAAHGISLEINGASSHRGIQVDMDAVSTGVGIAVLQNGLNHSLSCQSFNGSNTSAALLSDHAGNGRCVASRSYLTTHSSQTAYFVQSSAGLVPLTYANATAVWGQSDGIRGGALLAAGPSASTTVLQALYNGPAGNYDGVAILGSFQPSASYGYGVIGQGNWYGVFANGNSGASGAKTFMIDHPLDPENKFLKHFSIESPEVLNLYRGSEVLDADGFAEVQLPSYFHAVNIDFSYQLTPVGSAAAVFVAEEINAQGRFKIAGGSPGQKVCWTVYADRNDLFMQQNSESIQVEPLKRTADQGLYVQPELYGQPKEKGMFERYKVRPEEVKGEAAPVSIPGEVALPELKALK